MAGRPVNRRARIPNSSTTYSAPQQAPLFRGREVHHRGGSSAAIDLSLRLLALLRGQRLAQRVQLIAEWDPEPPFGPIDWTMVDTVAPLASTDHDVVDQHIALVIYDGLTVLDLVGPLEVMTALSRLRPDFVPLVVAQQKSPVTSDTDLTFRPNVTFADLPSPRVLIVPGGGVPTLRSMSNLVLRQYLRSAAAAADHTASECTGALLLASIGLLAGRDATTHWAYERYLPAFKLSGAGSAPTASSTRPVSPRASTWHCTSSRSWPARRLHREFSSPSATIPTPVRWYRLRPHAADHACLPGGHRSHCSEVRDQAPADASPGKLSCSGGSRSNHGSAGAGAVSPARAPSLRGWRGPVARARSSSRSWTF